MIALGNIEFSLTLRTDKMHNPKQIEAVCRSYCKLKNENPDEEVFSPIKSDFNVLVETLNEYSKRNSHPHWQDYIKQVEEFATMLEAINEVEHLEN